ncbi:MAG: hypothetical protein DI598_02910 [Pseudopedobacter saltans]|uniref:Uncharacterized protein n=1 Tax=Pseudopedobacter saltans TaxID=151895 RepID=A0A2W5FD29_9SPHI|nr:MAG: hypothetical protein DI598_02910 [Pseudopedobacter saltans]
MKKIIYCLMFIAVSLFFLSCEKRIQSKETDILPKTVSGGRPLPIGDINLQPDWDWTQPNWITYFKNASGSIGKITTINPFLDPSQKVYGKVNPAKADMYPSKGWMLVARDFGTESDANSYPFIIFYNKYRGILRICILRTNDVLSSYQRITLGFANNSSYPPLFKYIFGNNVNSESLQTSITTAGVNEWMIADFDASGYSENIDEFSAFNISLSEVVESEINLAGNIKLDGTAQPSASGTPSTLSQLNYIGNFYASTVEGAAKVVKTTGDEFKEGSASLFISSFYKLLKGFSGGNGSVYNINLSGPIKLQGSLTTSSPKTSFSVYLNNKQGLNNYRSLQDIPWGVFMIGDLSFVENYGNRDYYEDNPNGGDPILRSGDLIKSVIFEPGFITKASFKVNPVLANDIETIECVTIETNNWTYDIYGQMTNGGGIVKPETTISNFQKLEIFENDQENLALSSTNPGEDDVFKIGIKIMFKSGDVVYKTISVRHNI